MAKTHYAKPSKVNAYYPHYKHPYMTPCATPFYEQFRPWPTWKSATNPATRPGYQSPYSCRILMYRWFWRPLFSLPGRAERPCNSISGPKWGWIRGPLKPNSPSWRLQHVNFLAFLHFKTVNLHATLREDCGIRVAGPGVCRSVTPQRHVK